MSGLRQSILELIRTAGNASGCHQLADRSFFYKGKQFPVCARCTGVFLGHFSAIILFVLKKQIPLKKCCFFMGIMGIDWGMQETGIKKSTNIRRLITGYLGGLGLFSIYGFIIKHLWDYIVCKYRFL